MGLDQYLKAKRYIGAWEHSSDQDKESYLKIMEIAAPMATDPSGLKTFRCNGSPSLTVEVSVAYWRKANQIHGWFVKEVQDGKDDCGEYYVSPSKLQELRALCNEVLTKTPMVPGTVTTGKHIGPETGGEWVSDTEPGEVVADKTVAEELLPSGSGFFFGSTDYDQFYMDDLKRTVEMIDGALKLFPEKEGCWSFYYESSW